MKNQTVSKYAPGEAGPQALTATGRICQNEAPVFGTKELYVGKLPGRGKSGADESGGAFLPYRATAEEAAAVRQNYRPAAILKRDPVLKKIVDSLADGTFDDAGTGVLKAIYNSLLKGSDADRYLVLYDFADYMRAKLQVNADYGSDDFLTKCLINLSSAGRFSSDRAVKEYAENIWGTEA